MKKPLLTLVSAATAVIALNAQEQNLWPDGSFEKAKVATAAEKASFQKKKWDTDHFVILRPGWAPKGVHKMRLIDCAKNPDMEDNVRSGTKSLMLQSKGHFFTEKKFPKGKYQFQLYVKGEGRVCFRTYNYKKSGAMTDQTPLHGGLNTLGNDWKKFTYTTEFGGKHKDTAYFVLVIACVDGKPIYVDDITFTKVKKIIDRKGE